MNPTMSLPILDVMFTVRQEITEDISAIRRVTEMAFNGKTEADLVDALRAHQLLNWNDAWNFFVFWLE